MNNRTLVFGIAYSIVVILFKLIIVFGGYGLTYFGFYFSHLVSVLAIVPFIFLTIKYTQKDKGGIIGGKNALKSGLQMMVVAAIILSVYNAFEFQLKWKALSTEYYNSKTFLDLLAKKNKFKPEEYPTVISEAIAGLSVFKAVTGKLFILIFFSVSTSFICAIFFKGKN